MREGVYTWPDSSNSIELSYDWEAINWLLDNVRGNAVIVEAAWNTLDWERTEQLIKELDIALIYVGQLERYQHADGVQKLEAMAAENRLTTIHENERVIIYGVPEQISTWLRPDDIGVSAGELYISDGLYDLIKETTPALVGQSFHPDLAGVQ